MAIFVKRRTRKGERRVMARVHGIGARTFTTMADAKLWAGEMERRKRLGELYEAPPESFGDFLDAYLERKKLSWRESTTKDREQLATYLKPLRASTLKDLDRAVVEDLIGSVASHAPRRAQKALDLIKAVLKDARARKQRIDQSIFDIPSPRYESRPLRFLTWKQVEELASWMPEHVKRIVLVAALTGMRQGELFALKDEDLHLDEGYLNVVRGKTKNAERKVTLADEAVTILREQLLLRPHTSLVFPNMRGGSLNKDNFMYRYFQPARRACGLDEHVTFHSLRHTFVSLAGAAGVREETVAEMAGWSPQSWAQMKAHYRHFFPNEAPVEAAKLDVYVKREAG
jgi:integrase